MLRRHFLAALAACTAGRTVFAQQPARPKRIVHAGCVERSGSELAEVRRRRRAEWAKQGLVEGRDYYETLVFLCQPVPGEDERRQLQVVESRPDLIMVERGAYALHFSELTRDIPIVFHNVTDPVTWGLVESYGRPGRNLTGVSNGLIESMVKRIELLKEVRPNARRIAWLMARDNNPKPVQAFRDELSARAGKVGINLVDLELPVPERLTLDAVGKALCDAKVDGYLVYSSLPGVASEDFPSLQKRCGVPGFFGHARHVVNGGFASFGQSVEESIEHMFMIGARVLRGENPATIPVIQPARFDLAINLATARELRIDVPPAVIARAAEVIR